MAQKPKSAAQQQALLRDLKRHLRQEVLADVMKNGLTDSILGEYRELAGNSVRLLTLLERYGFIGALNDADRVEFEKIMKGLSVTGLRCQVLVEESYQLDYEAFLAVTPSESVRAN